MNARQRRRLHVGRGAQLFGVAAVLSLAACSGSTASPKAGAARVTSLPSSDQTSAAAAPASQAELQAAAGRCSIAPRAIAAARLYWNIDVGGDTARIKAGKAVAFVTTGNMRPTVTEGTMGKAVTAPCVDAVLTVDKPLLVTFPKPGVYHLFCRKRPTTMFTTVYVQ